MALIQQVRAAPLRGEDKAALDKAVQEAKSLMAKKANPKDLDKAYVHGYIGNAHRHMELKKEHNYEGHFVEGPRQSIPGRQFGLFLHEGRVVIPEPQPPHHVSKAALVYGNYLLEGQGSVNNVGVACGWILAWFSGLNDQRVYVRAGALSEIEKISWDEISEELKKAGPEGYYRDEKTGAEAHASIVPAEGNHAAIASRFLARKDV